jgi:hypothetical protein
MLLRADAVRADAVAAGAARVQHLRCVTGREAGVLGGRDAGVQTGELLLVTGQGPQRLHAYPQGLQRAG